MNIHESLRFKHRIFRETAAPRLHTVYCETYSESAHFIFFQYLSANASQNNPLPTSMSFRDCNLEASHSLFVYRIGFKLANSTGIG
jgi:hypothetical protein